MRASRSRLVERGLGENTPQACSEATMRMIWLAGLPSSASMADEGRCVQISASSTSTTRMLISSWKRLERSSRSDSGSARSPAVAACLRSAEHTSELPVTNAHLVCRLLLEKKTTSKHTERESVPNDQN